MIPAAALHAEAEGYPPFEQAHHEGPVPFVMPNTSPGREKREGIQHCVF